MFGKLLKNDLKAQFHSMSAIFFAIVIIAVGGEFVALFAKSDLGKIFGGVAVMAALLFACVFILYLLQYPQITYLGGYQYGYRATNKVFPKPQGHDSKAVR